VRLLHPGHVDGFTRRTQPRLIDQHAAHELQKKFVPRPSWTAQRSWDWQSGHVSMTPIPNIVCVVMLPPP
jgi:hypothetical protein